MVGKCFIDGNDIYSTYGVVIEKSEGALGVLQMKDRKVHVWPDEHGESVDLDSIYFEGRDITLRCYIEGTSAANYVTRIKNFFNALSAPKFRYLKFANINKGYLVYLRNGSDVIRLTNFTNVPVIGKFTLQFRVPNPVDRQFVCTGSSCSLTITCTKTLTIWWGDGTTDTVVGTSQTKSKNYGTSATRYVVLYGSVEAISALSVTSLTEITN